MSMSKSEIASIIREAANILEKQSKHVTGASREFINGKTCYCAGGAIGEVIRQRMPSVIPANFYVEPFNFFMGAPEIVDAVKSKDVYSIQSFNDSHSKEETVAYMRSKADELAPPEKNVTLDPPSPKPAMPPKKGTKRYYAKLFRDGAKFLDTHNHTACALVRQTTSGPCYCAMGAVAMASGEATEGMTQPELCTLLNRLFGDGGDWYGGHANAIGRKLIYSAALATLGPDGARDLVVSANDCYAAPFSDGSCISTAAAKANVQRFMRTIAYMLEHGGKLPSWLEKPASDTVTANAAE